MIYKIPNARSNTVTSDPSQSIDEIWSRAEVVAQAVGKHNTLTDYKQDYFHDFAITNNHVIFQLTSLKIDYMKMPLLMLNQEPLAYGAFFDHEANTTFYVQNRTNPTGNPKSFGAPTALNFHVIHAYETDNKVDNNNIFGYLNILSRLYTTLLRPIMEINLEVFGFQI